MLINPREIASAESIDHIAVPDGLQILRGHPTSEGMGNYLWVVWNYNAAVPINGFLLRYRNMSPDGSFYSYTLEDGTESDWGYRVVSPDMRRYGLGNDDLGSHIEVSLCAFEVHLGRSEWSEIVRDYFGGTV